VLALPHLQSRVPTLLGESVSQQPPFFTYGVNARRRKTVLVYYRNLRFPELCGNTTRFELREEFDKEFTADCTKKRAGM
jgi:hypothetical protein